MANYAWTTIRAGDNTIKLGDTVSAADVGGKDELERLKAEGVVRGSEYPVPEGVSESPVNHRLNELRAEVEELQAANVGSEAAFAVASNAGAEVEEISG